jgi:HSP20 family protein
MLQPLMVSLFRELGSGPRLDPVPLADVYRRGGDVVVHVDMPGVDPASVRVTVEGSLLSIGAERSYAPEPTDQVLLSERSFGRFQRQFRLRDRVDAGNVRAVLDNGVLTVSLPVAGQESQQVTVEVRTGAQAADEG